MASIIRIKRSAVSGNPATLGAGELAYSALADNGSNGGDRLYIGMGTETSGNAVNHVIIGGKRYTDLVDAATNANTALTIVKRDASGNFSAGTITAALIGNASTATGLATARTIAFTGDATATGSFDGTANYSQALTLATVNSNVGSFGSATSIPIITVNAKGLVTGVTTASSSVTIGSTAISLGGTATTIAGLTSVTSTTFVGALTGNASTATTLATARNINGVSFNGSADITVPAAAGTLTGTTLNATVTASSLTSVGTITSGTWNGTTIAVANGGTGTANGSITGSGALTFTAAAGNNNINLVPTGTGVVDHGGKRATNAADPTQAQDLATKAYVDSLSNGLDVKASVIAASTGTLTATYSNGTAGVGATLTNAGTQAALVLDSIALSIGNRVLIKDQASTLQNGVYDVTVVGSVSTNWVLTRSSDFDNSPGLEVGPGVFFFVEQGATQADNGYVISTDTAITIGTTAITFSQFSGAGQITAGAGLTKTGNTIDVIGTANRITVATDSIDIASTYVGQASITTLGTIGTGIWNGNVIGATYGGTGVNNGSNTLTLAGSVTHAGAFAQTFTATGVTTLTLPTTGTLSTLAGIEALTNKTITASSFAGSVAATTLSASGLVTLTNATDATALGTAAVVLSGGLSVNSQIRVGGNVTGAGAATSTLDGFSVDGGTY